MRNLTYFLIGLAVVALVTTLAMPFHSAAPPNTPPTDQSLVDELHGRQVDYDSLLHMFVADRGFGRVAYDFTRRANFFSGTPQADTTPMTAAKLDKYRKLFDRLSLTAGIEGYDQKHVIFFWRYASGLLNRGTAKGLAYSDSMPRDKSSADGCSKPMQECWQFRPIGAGWFIVEEHN